MKLGPGASGGGGDRPERGEGREENVRSESENGGSFASCWWAVSASSGAIAALDDANMRQPPAKRCSARDTPGYVLTSMKIGLGSAQRHGV